MTQGSAGQADGMIVRKNMAELEKMRAAGLLVWKILDTLKNMVGEGVTTYDLEVTAEKMMSDAGARPAFKGYSTAAAGTKFPFVLCTSVNEEIVHGMPSQRRVLKDGDIVSIDTGVQLNGYYGDSAVTVAVGEISGRDAAAAGCDPGIAGAGDRQSAAGQPAVRYLRNGGEACDLQRVFGRAGVCGSRHRNADARGAADSELCGPAQRESAAERGHGAGDRADGECRKPGSRVKADKWTAVTEDGKYSAHFEHTVAVTANGPWVLTRP